MSKDYHCFGGEPLEPINQEGLLPLLKKVKEELPEKNIWCWTGYNFDTDILNKMYLKNETTQELLNYIDIIVDGQFEIENKVADLAFRGSTNQRKIDVQKSLQEGKMVRLKFGDEARYESKKPKIMHFEEFKKAEKDLTKQTMNHKIPVNLGMIQNLQEEQTEPKRVVIKQEKEMIAAKGID